MRLESKQNFDELTAEYSDIDHLPTSRRYNIAAVVVQVILLHCKYVLAVGAGRKRSPCKVTKLQIELS